MIYVRCPRVTLAIFGGAFKIERIIVCLLFHYSHWIWICQRRSLSAFKPGDEKPSPRPHSVPVAVETPECPAGHPRTRPLVGGEKKKLCVKLAVTPVIRRGLTSWKLIMDAQWRGMGRDKASVPSGSIMACW
jgi:hypothetical protein